MTSSMTDGSAYAAERETTEGRVFTVTGGDWDTITGSIDPLSNEKIVVNMGPQHPSTHGVLRLVLELEGETVTAVRPVVGYLHTGIEKSLEYRNWTQGVTFVTRMDYLSNMHNEVGYCLAVEKLLGVTDQITERTNTIRVMFMELQRIASHLVWLGTTGLELGAISMMLYGFREREYILDIFEEASGLRMNNGYIRPGGLAQDLPASAVAKVRDFLKYMPKKLKEYEDMLSGQVIWHERTQGVAVLDVTGCLALGVTGPVLRSAGLAWDLRKTMPYCGYETYEFDVPTATTADVWGRYQVRIAEIRESLKIVEQALDRLRPGSDLDRGQEDRVARAAGHRHGRARQLARARCQDHGPVHGVADPPLQAGDRGLPGSPGPGVCRDRTPARRARCARGLRRRHPPVPRALPRPQLREPAGPPRDGRRCPARRRDRRRCVPGPRDGWV